MKKKVKKNSENLTADDVKKKLGTVIPRHNIPFHIPSKKVRVIDDLWAYHAEVEKDLKKQKNK